MMKQKLVSMLTHYTWDIAYFDYNVQDFKCFDFRKLHYIKNPYRDKWFADPFILDVTDEELVLLVEEFDYSINRGRIAKIVVDRIADTIVDCKIILDLSTHLSFPAIYREGGKLYVHPENSASGASFMYEYDRNSDVLINPICVLDEPVTDAIIRKQGDCYIMSATCLPAPNGNILRYYTSDNLTGLYKFVSEELFKDNTARMAGAFISYEGKMIRPAQDCCGAYGKAVVFYDGQNDLSWLAPRGITYCGIHTYNSYKGIGIIDLKKWDHPILVAIKDCMKKLVR